MSDEHEPFIKTPKQLIAVIVLSFVIPIVGIIMLVSYVGSSERDGAGSGGLTNEAIAQRIAPVAGFEIVDASAPVKLAGGEEVYTTQCAACHTAGLAGAPKFADVAAWEPRLAQGYDGLLGSALKGKGAMAAQGGGKFSDLEIGLAVVHMANAAGADFAEPSAEPSAETPEAKADPVETVKTAAQAVATEVTEKAAATVTAATEGSKAIAAEVVDKAEQVVQSAADSAKTAVAAAATAVVTAVAPKVETPAPATGHDLAVGKKTYGGMCTACHQMGIAGAPKSGDLAAWAGRAEKGVEALTATVLKGKGAMPPRGGSQASDEDIAAAVAYMLSELK